ncbi:hypothetical protein ACOSQ3_007954 [Xanthoceras sorbifolium]
MPNLLPTLYQDKPKPIQQIKLEKKNNNYKKRETFALLFSGGNNRRQLEYRRRNEYSGVIILFYIDSHCSYLRSSPPRIPRKTIDKTHISSSSSISQSYSFLFSVDFQIFGLFDVCVDFESFQFCS